MRRGGFLDDLARMKSLDAVNRTRHSGAVDAQTIANMKARVAQCRRVAAMTHNPEIIAIMQRMAAEGEADIKRLEEAASHAMPGPLQSQ
jgi:hypothetical protein